MDNINETFKRLVSRGSTKKDNSYHVGENLINSKEKDPFGNLIGHI
jgi:hypothetical protein